MQKILAVVPDKYSREIICGFLGNAGYETVQVSSVDEALCALREEIYDFILTDTAIGGFDGDRTVAAMRRVCRASVVLLTDDDTPCGIADAVLKKPFSLASLTSILAKLTLNQSKPYSSKRGDPRGLTLDRSRAKAFVDGIELPLTGREFEILEVLERYAGKVLTREQLLSEIWGDEYAGDTRTVDSHIARLRSKLGDWGTRHLKTIYGTGYRLELVERNHL